MHVLMITHPDSAARSPRPLSNGGQLQALCVARRLREIVGKKSFLVAIMSSPKTRCLETAILVAREFSETTKNKNEIAFDRIEVSSDLEEKQEAIKLDKMKQLLDKMKQSTESLPDSVLLLSMHGDLANVISESTSLAPGFASDGWFDVRPVITVCDFSEGKLSFTHCETLNAGSWKTCLET